jgi:hypothetical protein
VLFGPPGDAVRYRGGIVAVRGDVFTLRLWDRTAHRVDATLRIAVSGDGSRFVGLLDASAHRYVAARFAPAPALVGVGT